MFADVEPSRDHSLPGPADLHPFDQFHKACGGVFAAVGEDLFTVVVALRIVAELFVDIFFCGSGDGSFKVGGGVADEYEGIVVGKRLALSRRVFNDVDSEPGRFHLRIMDFHP